MKRVALVIAKEGFRDEEYLEPKEILHKNGINVTTVSSIKGLCAGKLGAKVSSDIALDEIKVNDFDGIFFIGGPGSSEYFNNKQAHKALRDAVKLNKIVGAICIAPTTLAKAGILNGKKATGFPSAESDLRSNGAVWTGKDLEIDGKIITADGPQSATKFGQAIVTLLGKSG
jgi:protease I